jgi:hypothetical protein
MGLAGKPQGMDGGNVETYQRDDRIKEIAQYCESDVINAYRVWLRYELFLGKLNPQFYEVRELISAALRPAPGAVAADRNVGRCNSRWRRKNHAASAASAAAVSDRLLFPLRSAGSCRK